MEAILGRQRQMLYSLFCGQPNSQVSDNHNTDANTVEMCNLFVVLETIRTGAMRVVHIHVKTEETQRLRITFVSFFHCSSLSFSLSLSAASSI